VISANEEVTVLTCLRVREFAIIEQQEVVFEPGLNIVTGETGAGKSIMVDALQLVLGARGRAELVRTGASQADVEALFDVSDDPVAQARLEGVDIEVEDEVVLHRVNQANGRTRAYVNAKMTTAAQLRRLAAGLVDISSQHQHHTLANPATHLGFLDSFAEIDDLEQQMGAAWTRLIDARTAVREVEEQTRNRYDREGYLRYQLSELAGIDLEPGQDQELTDEVRRLRHSERLSRATQGAEAVLYEQENSVTVQLTRVIGGLKELAAIDPRLAEVTQQLESARVELEEAARVLGTYGRNVHADPERQAELESKLHQLRRLERKYGGSLEAMLAYREEVILNLEELVKIEVHLEQRQAELDRALAAASAIARELSDRRKEAAGRLAQAITDELNELGMGEAQVQVDVAPFDSQSHDFAVDDAPLTSTGIDRVEFLIAPNPGEEPRPLAKVASGGEISRALLALKTVLSGAGPAGTYVFDEVDAGVGGAVAEVIGRKLQQIARHHQVICITHLPQIAAFGEVHFFVSKSTREGRTRSSIERLDTDGRVKELANMMGGKQHGRSTRKAAEDMLAKAQMGAVEDPEGPTG
jgi:DNA repair protein RecN (Recombination protein N)